MAKENSGRIVAVIAVFLLLVLLVFLLVSYNSASTVANSERFYSNQIGGASPSDAYSLKGSVASNAPVNPDDASGTDALYKNSSTQPPVSTNVSPVGGPGSGIGSYGSPTYAGLPAGTPTAACYPRDRLTADDLLPKDAANSRWAQMNPAGQGDIGNQNYLTAAYHYGINTQGQTLKNANHQLRSDPPNPQVPVSPWNISTIEYDDRGGKTLEIGGPA